MLHPAANRHPKATHQWLLIGTHPYNCTKASRNVEPRRQQLPQGHIHRFVWAAQPAFRPLKRFNILLACFIPQPTGTPKARSILLGVQVCRLPACTQFVKRYPKARSIASSRRSSLPFTTFLFDNAVLDRKLLPTDPSMVYLPCLHVTGHIPFASGAKCKHTLSPSQRCPSQKTGSHRPFDGLLDLSSRHWPHSLCKRGKCKHTLFPSQRPPSQKTGSHRPFDGLFALSWCHWPHSLCKRGKCKHTLSPSQRRPWQKTGSHRPFDGLFVLFNSDFVLIAADCLWFWFGCHYWCFFHDFDLDMTVGDCLWFCFAVDLFFHDPAWDMIVDYCYYFSCGFIYWSCPATPTKGGRRHQGASPFYFDFLP